MKNRRFHISLKGSLQLAAALILVIASGCSRQEPLPSAPSFSSGRNVATPSRVAPKPSEIASVREVKERAWNRLKLQPGVIGMGIGWEADGAVFIGVHVEKANVADALGLGREIDGVPVRVNVITRAEFFAKPPASPPLLMGTSSGEASLCSGGTVGCVVESGRRKYLLSCNHVFSPENESSLGNPVMAPARRAPDCNPQPIVATVSDFVPRIIGGTHTMDAAIASINSKVNYTCAMVSGYTPTSTVVEPVVGLAIKKTGARTSLRSGTVSMIHYTTNVGGCEFTDQIFVDTDNFSLPGDSGALVVTETGNNPVALVIGGGSGDYTIATPIQRILDEFGVTICSE